MIILCDLIDATTVRGRSRKIKPHLSEIKTLFSSLPINIMPKTSRGSQARLDGFSCLMAAQQLVDITGLPHDMCLSLMKQAGGSISVAVELALDAPKEQINEGLSLMAHRLHNTSPPRDDAMRAIEKESRTVVLSGSPLSHVGDRNFAGRLRST